jgi:hypothetical protein
MQITIKEPSTGEDIRLDAQPEYYKGAQGWRIIYPQKDSFVIARENGEWIAADEADINPDLIAAIADAIRDQENEEYTSMSKT